MPGLFAKARLMNRRIPEANLDHPALSVKPPVPLGLEAHFGPAWHEWLYRIAPNIITLKRYHGDNVGNTVGQENGRSWCRCPGMTKFYNIISL